MPLYLLFCLQIINIEQISYGITVPGSTTAVKLFFVCAKHSVCQRKTHQGRSYNTQNTRVAVVVCFCCTTLSTRRARLVALSIKSLLFCFIFPRCGCVCATEKWLLLLFIAFILLLSVCKTMVSCRSLPEIESEMV